ncbi:MAG: lysozyme inhibitor LprI family protein [Campylobacter sp.]
MNLAIVFDIILTDNYYHLFFNFTQEIFLMKKRFSTLAIATILGLSAGFANADPVKVKDIQRKWVAYKEAKCAFYPQQGSIHRLDAADCYLQMTKERATELAYVAEEFEGNQ